MKNTKSKEKGKRKVEMRKIRLTKRQAIVFATVAVLVAVILAIVCWQGLEVTTYTLTSDKIDEEIRLCVITDHHSSSYGKDQRALVSAIDEQYPDVVLIVGDLFDRGRSTKNAEALLSAIGEKYTCFYTTGNHEFRSEDCEKLKALVRTYGVTVLDEDVIELSIKGQVVNICGVDDLFAYGDTEEEGSMYLNSALSLVNDEAKENGGLSVLLSHRPQQADIYARYDFDLVLSGHNHGGQVWVPFLDRGLYTPTDGLFPEYSGGVYEISDSTSMIVSRGLCKNILPRVFNRPELVIVDIKPE